jgi:hypothetical protein
MLTQAILARKVVPMRIQSVKTRWSLAALLILLTLALSLAAQQSNLLLIAGQPGSAKVIQVDGRKYVEVEGLVRLTKSSISLSGNQIILTLPGSNTDAAPPATSATGFSKDFVAAGMETMAQIREWHAALKNAIDRSIPLGEDWLTANRAQAQQALRLASLAASTDADKNAYPFLSNEFNNMRQLSDKYLQMSKSMTYIAPGSLDSDPLDQKMRACGHSLASMATANQFVDDGSCQ